MKIVRTWGHVTDIASGLDIKYTFTNIMIASPFRDFYNSLIIIKI